MSADKEAPLDERAKLLPCPFCGEAPTMIAETERDGFVREFVAHCDTCAIGKSAEYESDAIAAWNRRAGQQEQAVLSDLSDERIAEIYQSAFNATPDRKRDAPRPHALVFEFARAILAASADLDRGLLAQVLDALTRLVARIDANGGIGAYKAGPAFVMEPARAAIAAIRSRLEQKP